MQFLIDDTRYFMREETEGIFSLMNLKTNQVFSFLSAGKLLLKHTGQWTDFDQFIKSIRTKTPPEKVRKMFSSMLFELHAGGLALLKDIPEGNFTGIRMADRNDYYHLSAFCRKYCAEGFSCARVVSGSYYSMSGLYERLRRQDEMIMMAQENGKIRAVLITAVSKRFFGGNIPELISFIFDDSLTQEECARLIGQLSDAAAAQFGRPWTKIRYEHTDPRQDFTVSVLEKNGFEKTAEFAAEINGKGTLSLYDKQV